MIRILFFIIVIAMVLMIISFVVLRVEGKRNSKAHLFYHSECPNYFGPHGDTIMSIFVKQTKDKISQLIDPKKMEWEIITKTQSEPEGACGEYVQIKELRNNRSVWEYHVCWIKKYEWLLQFDLPRLLTDKSFFNEYLQKAEAGDSDAQTIIGSCYAYCLELAKPVITQDEGKALYWWNKAAEQGHRYAMMELAIYYSNKKEIEKAIEWHEKSGCHVYSIERLKHLRELNNHLTNEEPQSN